MMLINHPHHHHGNFDNDYDDGNHGFAARITPAAQGSPKKKSFDKLGFLDQAGGGGLTEDQLFCKIVKTKLTFVNGQKCDETHNT